VSDNRRSMHLRSLVNGFGHGSRQSPVVVRVKEEDDHDMLDATPSPPLQNRPLQPKPSQDSAGMPQPSLLAPPSKKRRVTVSGGHALGLNTDVRAPSLDPSSTTPISPAVMGFTIGRDDPAAIEQVRSMLTVKQRQKALIEQRRGSLAGGVNIHPSNGLSNEQRRGSVAGILTVPPSGNSPRAPVRLSLASTANSSDDRAMPKPTTSVRSMRRSPNMGSIAGTNRRIGNPPAASGQSNGAHPTSPISAPVAPAPAPAPPAPSQQTPSQPTQPPTDHHLPPPPISFARRRADQFGPGKNKPADIVISPREAQSPDQLAPTIQSAPPVPHASISRFPMTLPRLPSAMGDSQKTQRLTSGRVPPTPTRLTMQHGPSTTAAGLTGRSPPSASVPISSTLIPPTPTSFHRPGYVGEKSAFLAPFEMFYDSLNDSKQLKTWLAEQVQKSNALMQSLQHQQEKMDEIVERVVEKKMGRFRDEITGLHQKVEELEGALRLARADEGRRLSIDAFGGKGRGKFMVRNGLPAPEPPTTYTFPPVEPPKPEFLRRLSSPGWAHEPDRESRGPDRSPLSVSSSRHEPPRSVAIEPTQSRGPQGQSRGVRSPSETSAKSALLMPANSRSSQPPRSSQHERSTSHHRHRSSADTNDVSKPTDETSSISTGASRKDVVMSPPQDIRRAPTEGG
jgi:hypothetical protein